VAQVGDRAIDVGAGVSRVQGDDRIADIQRAAALEHAAALVGRVVGAVEKAKSARKSATTIL
jgi:hypothetical protein